MTFRMRAREILARILTLLLLITVAAPASAQETITYTYDARGRVVTINHGTTGPNTNVVSSYAYDGADNRCQQIVRTDGTTATPTCPNVVNIVLSPTTLPSGTVSTFYSSTITASGGTSPYTFTKSSGTLPTGLTLGSGGVLSGTPSAAATYSFVIMATDSASNTGSQAYSVTISGGGVTLTLLPTSLASGTVGTAYTQTITASGGTGGYTYAVSAGTLPAGLNLNGSTGVISGTPTTAATSNFTIKATDSSSDTGTRAYSVTVSNGALVANSWSQTISACGTANVDVVGQLNDSDPDGDQVTVSGVSNVTRGSATYSGTVVTYTTTFPTGTGSLTYTISDGHGDTASNTMSFNISGGVCP